MKKYILIVDDEELQRMTMQSRLQSAGFNVDVAAGGEEAFALMKENPYDVVLLDIRMPDIDGIEVLSRITKQYPGIEVIMTTGFADFMTAVECLKNGARDYLVKPIHPTELVTRLNTLLRERELRQSLAELKRNFSSVALYTLLNPMNSLTTIIEHISKGKSGPVSREQAYLLNYARKIGEKTTDTIRQFSGLSQSSGDSSAPERRMTDIAALIENVCMRYEILARPKGLKITKSITRPLAQIMCEPDEIVQVLNNILDYSLEHSLSGGTVSVSAVMKSPEGDQAGKGQVMFTIRDSGIGIPGNGLTQIFKEKGNGLTKLSSDLKLTEIGLAISKNIIESHHGQFDVDFEADSGNMFVVTLPAAG
jgi:DNA-binding response OmpR family regulator